MVQEPALISHGLEGLAKACQGAASLLAL
jgi:hypothetical protein